MFIHRCKILPTLMMSLSFVFKIQYYKWHWIFQQLFDVIAYATIISIVAPSSIYLSIDCGHMDGQDFALLSHNNYKCNWWFIDIWF